MTSLLRIDVSTRGTASHSRRFADEAAAHLLATHKLDRVVRRDLGNDPLPAIDEAYVRAMLTHKSREASSGVPPLVVSEEVIEELDAADALLISTPVHNYTVPAALKVWIDHIVRVGRTFASTPNGKLGTLRDRPALVVAASGGYFSGPTAQPDFLAPYVDAVLATVGIQSVSHIRLEGLTRGDEAIAKTYHEARKALAALPMRSGRPSDGS